MPNHIAKKIELIANLAIVVLAPLRQLNVTGTPTLLLVNDQGVVTKSWVGQLGAQQEAQVVKAVQSGSH